MDPLNLHVWKLCTITTKYDGTIPSPATTNPTPHPQAAWQPIITPLSRRGRFRRRTPLPQLQPGRRLPRSWHHQRIPNMQRLPLPKKFRRTFAPSPNATTHPSERRRTNGGGIPDGASRAHQSSITRCRTQNHMIEHGSNIRTNLSPSKRMEGYATSHPNLLKSKETSSYLSYT